MRSSTLATYSFALAALAAALVLRAFVDPFVGDTLPFVTVFGAVALAVWLGGIRPAVLVTLLGYAGAYYFFIPPRGHIAPADLSTAVGLGAYLFTCGLIVVLGESMRSARLRASAQRETLQVTLRSIGDAVITTGVDARVTYLNAVAETLTGWGQREALGQPLDAVFRIRNQATHEPVENPAVRALREGIVVGLANHTVLVRKDGRELPIDDSAAPIRDDGGQVSGCVLIFRDVTAQRRMEQEQGRQLITARLLASIIESSDDAIIRKGLDGVIQSWNAAAERLFGHSAEQAVGSHISLIIPPERIAEEDQIIGSLKAGQKVEHFETERVRADGQRVWVSLTISPIRDKDGNLVAASKIVRDVTRQRQADAERETLTRELQEADRRKNEFIAMLAHELRNPLAPISNATQALRLGARDEATIDAAAGMLERQVGQLSRLVDDLLDISRITRGRLELRRERCELTPIVQHAVEAVRALYRSQDHALQVVLPPNPVYLDADPARLTQVVGNLLNNACKFTNRGGQVMLAAEQAGGQAIIRVRDNGIGLNADALPRVFDMFTQVDTSLERSRDGLGIGLTLVKTLVEMHGGRVEVHSDGPGRGSEFIVHLPLAAQTAALPAAAPVRAAAVPQSRRVLIVDDNPDGAESLAMLLGLSGYETDIANDGIEAVKAAERLRPDAILLDIGLPGLNGYEVCRRIREQPWGARMRLIALTGWGQEEDRHRSSEAGFDAHLVKPVDHDALLALLAAERAQQVST